MKLEKQLEARGYKKIIEQEPFVIYAKGINRIFYHKSTGEMKKYQVNEEGVADKDNM